MDTSIQQQSAPDAHASIFSRVLVGIDDSPESLEAARQAETLATGPLTLFAAYDLTETVVGAGMAPAPPAQLDEEPFRQGAEEALDDARRELSGIEPIRKVGRGRAWKLLLDEIAAHDDTLVVVGSHGAGRAKGIVIGSTATELVHKAPCSVLVARTPLKGSFPASIVVGVDGSKESAAADEVARELARRFDAPLDHFDSVPDPVGSLVEASMEADLVVVGSRGLHGFKAIGSVSERVAHEARCSVLVVR